MLQQTTLLGQGAILSAIGRADVGSQLKKHTLLFLCFVDPQSRGLLGEKTSSMLMAYIKYNRDLTRKLSARMLRLWELPQTCPVAMKHHSLEYNLQRWDTSQVRLETLGEF